MAQFYLNGPLYNPIDVLFLNSQNLSKYFKK